MGTNQSKPDRSPIMWSISAKRDRGERNRRSRDVAEQSETAPEQPITHLVVDRELPSFEATGAHITHLRIDDLDDFTQLHRLKKLPSLQSLRFTDCDFSKGLPAVITQLTSLKSLILRSCQLTKLPRRLANMKQLKELDLSGNNFSEHFPLVVTKMTSLETLKFGKGFLRGCGLKDLPAQFSKLKKLRVLDLSYNALTHLPHPLFSLKKLQTLHVNYNTQLSILHQDIEKLENLMCLYCVGCYASGNPPYAVCKLGLSAVQKYFADVKNSKRVKWSSVPVAVIGTSLSGKTSLMRSLKNRKRELTFRSKYSPEDETTKVFKVEDLNLGKFTVKFIDYGGQDVYHLAYSIAKKDLCLPIVVVNVKEFRDLATSRGPKEATKTLIFDWMSHLYVACPRLGPPILALTHIDQLTSEELKQCKQDLLENAEIIKADILAEEEQLSCGSVQTLQGVDHLQNNTQPLIHPDDIFEFSDDLNESTSIMRLISNLENRCAAYTTVIPEEWDNVLKILEEDKSFHITVNEVRAKFPMEGLEIVLKYLHNSGAIIWFQEVERLSSCIFHNVEAVVDMILLLFHHCVDEQWAVPIENFRFFIHDGEKIEKERYIAMAEEFTRTGVLAEALLVNLLQRKGYPAKVSLDLLQSFHMLYGPLNDQSTKCYIAPYFARNNMSASWKIDGDLQLRMRILLKGLAPPKSAFHLIMVAVLNCTADPLATTSVKRNGATIRYGDCAVHLHHDHQSGEVDIQVSSSVEELGNSWKKLLKIVDYINTMLFQAWPACRLETLFYCAHCCFLHDQNPSFVVHPRWLYSEGAINFSQIKTFSGLQLVTCKNCPIKEGQLTPAVPCPLVFPCYDLSTEDIQKLTAYLKKLKQSRATQVNMTRDVLRETSSTPTQSQPSATSESRPAPRHHIQSADNDSDLSDSLDYLDEEHVALDFINMRINSVNRPEIRKLFSADTVYRMSSPVRGRCFIINNRQFEVPTTGNQVELSDRPGSEMDVKNLQGVFKQLSFNCGTVHIDLSSQEMVNAIKEETQNPEHQNYGMFVLILMTHGKQTLLYGSDGRPVNLSVIYDLMSPRQFKMMAGKPKWIIIQACSGGRKDMLGEAHGTDGGGSPTSALQSTASSLKGIPLDEHLATDDLFIMRPSFYSYLSTRHSRNGSWFVRALVESLYKHSCHRDIQTLFEQQVKKKVRAKSIVCHKQLGYTSGQQPTMECFPTKNRKLYLFPGYNPRI